MKHLTLSDRIRIEAFLDEGKSFSQIATEIEKRSTTISREIRRHRSIVYYDENVPLFRKNGYRKSGTMILRVRSRDTALN